MRRFQLICRALLMCSPPFPSLLNSRRASHITANASICISVRLIFSGWKDNIDVITRLPDLFINIGSLVGQIGMGKLLLCECLLVRANLHPLQQYTPKK